MKHIVKSHYKNFSKFSVVGVANTVIDYGMFYVFHDIFDIHYILANILAVFIALINSFICNALWTFKNLRRDCLIRQVTTFFVIGFIGMGLNTLTVFIAQGYMNVYIAKLLATFVSFSWNYVGSWLFVFKHKA